MKNLIARLALCALPVLTACAPQAYLLKNPQPSGLRAPVALAAGETLTLVDARQGAERDFNTGTLPATLQADGAAIDPPAFLATHLQAELASRGLGLKLRKDASGSPMLKLHSFRVVNHRSNGFAPFVTLTYLAADIDTPTGTQRVAAFVRRGKVPVWSFDEVVEPTFNQPMSLAVKELASKIASRRYGYQGSDAQVEALIAKLRGPRSPESFLDVHALGTLHNAKALALPARPDRRQRRVRARRRDLLAGPAARARPVRQAQGPVRESRWPVGRPRHRAEGDRRPRQRRVARLPGAGTQALGSQGQRQGSAVDGAGDSAVPLKPCERAGGERCMKRRQLLPLLASPWLPAQAGMKDWLNGAALGRPLPVHEMQQLAGPPPGAASRLTLLDFWATWCAPCLNGLAHLDALHRELQAEGLRVLGLSPERPEAVRAFLAKRPLSYAIAVDGEPGLHKLLRIRAMPYALLLDAKGLVIWRGEPGELQAQGLRERLRAGA